MKANDIITPGDYEVRPYKGGEHKARIVKVEKRSVRVYDGGRDVSGHRSDQWRAIAEQADGREFEYPLAQVIRPWADAIADHDAAEADKREGRRVRNLLQDTLNASGIKARVDGCDRFTVSLDREQAEALADLINQLPAE